MASTILTIIGGALITIPVAWLFIVFIVTLIEDKVYWILSLVLGFLLLILAAGIKQLE